MSPAGQGQPGVTLVLDSAPSCPPNQVNYSLLTDICNLWRNYGDIQDSWSSVLSVLDWFVDHQDILQPVAGPGHWNDPDMVPAWRGMGLLPTALCPLTGRTLRGSRSALKCVLEPGALDSPWDLLTILFPGPHPHLSDQSVGGGPGNAHC